MVLGITLNDRLSATDHVNHLLTSCSSLLYAMRVLRGHGISTVSLQDVFRATILTKITYCLPAWSGLCSASDRAKLDSFLNRCKRLGFCGDTVPTISDIFTALHVMQTRSSDENSVCLSVCLSVRHTREL